MPKYASMCQNKQDCEHTWSPKYAKILNMAKFWIWQGSQYVRIKLNIPEYALTEFWIYLWFCIYQDSGYGRVLNMQEYKEF